VLVCRRERQHRLRKAPWVPWVLSCAAAITVATGAARAQQAVTTRYYIQPSDSLTIRYLYSPEYDHVAVVQPDGYMSAPIVGELRVGGLTLTQAREAIVAAAGRRLRDPEVFVDLKELDKPHFVVGGEVGAPGRFELRTRTSVLEAIAMAGGFKPSSLHSQVLLFRRHDQEHAEATLIDAKDLMKGSNPAGDVALQAGDMVVVPQNKVSKVERIIKWVSIGVYLNPFAFIPPNPN
jgi:polysaccharide export outer membrane protein